MYLNWDTWFWTYLLKIISFQFVSSYLFINACIIWVKPHRVGPGFPWAKRHKYFASSEFMSLAIWVFFSWWRHQIETFSALLAIYAVIPLTMASGAELWCFHGSAPEQTVDQTIDTPVTWDAIALSMTSLSMLRKKRQLDICFFYESSNVCSM